MQRIIFASFLFVALLWIGGCQTTMESPNDNSQPVAVVQPFRLFVGGEELPLDGTARKIHQQTATEISLPAAGYVYLMQCQGAQVKVKEFTPTEAYRKVALREFCTDTEFNSNANWFVLHSEQPIADHTKLKAALLAAGSDPAKEIATNVFPRNVAWRFFTAQVKDNDLTISQPMIQLEVQKAPLALQFYVQRKGEAEFRQFIPTTQDLQAGDRLQLKMEASSPTQVALFLDDRHASQGERKIVQIFPETGDASVPVVANSIVEVPGNRLGMAVEPGDEKRLYIFTNDQQLSCLDLKTNLQATRKVATGVVNEEETLPPYLEIKLGVGK